MNLNDPRARKTETEFNDAPQYRRRNRARRSLLIAIVSIIVAALLATLMFWVNRTQTERSDRAGGSGADAARELVVGLQLEPTNLDILHTGGVALDQILIDNVYQGLIGLRPGTVDEFVPVLAEELPEVSADGLRYTFTLREGVSFASGNPLTSADVVDSLSRTEGQASLRTSLNAPVRVREADERTIVLELDTPHSQLLWHLANRPGLILESDYPGDLATTTNGTGPFTLEQWLNHDSIVFERTADYWGDAPTIDRVVWRYLTDANAAVNAALEGELDVLAPVPGSLVEQLNASDFTIHRASSTDVFTLAFNSSRAPLNDVRVRQALSLAIEDEAIVASFYGDGKPLGGPLTDLEAAYEDLSGVHSYNPERARALLAEAGYGNGLELTLTAPNFYDSTPINQVVTQFADIGVTLQLRTVEFGVWLSEVFTEHDFELSYVNHTEAHDFTNYLNADYYFGYDNARARELYAQSIIATDPETAVSLIRQAARSVAEDAPAIWLINYTPPNALAAQVRGFPEHNTNSRIPVAQVSLE